MERFAWSNTVKIENRLALIQSSKRFNLILSLYISVAHNSMSFNEFTCIFATICWFVFLLIAVCHEKGRSF